MNVRLGRALFQPGAGGAAFVRGLQPAAWFRYGQGITFDSTGISQWEDASGNGRHLKQTASVLSRPWFAPNPTAPNLVTNGTFDTDTAGWSAAGDGTISSVGGRLRITQVAGGATAFAVQAVVTEAGKRYTLCADLVVDAATGNCFVQAGTVSGSANLGNNNIQSNLARNFTSFVAAGNTTYVMLATSPAALAGEYVEFDNVEVRESEDAVIFDGVNDYLKTDPFTLEQPETVYWLGKQVTAADGERIFDGNSSSSGSLRQALSSGNLSITAGVAVGNRNLALNTYGVVAAVFNGASSVLQVGTDAQPGLDPGANNMGGFHLGALGGAGGGFSNIQVKEAIIFASAHDDATRARVINYLMRLGGPA